MYLKVEHTAASPAFSMLISIFLHILLDVVQVGFVDTILGLFNLHRSLGKIGDIPVKHGVYDSKPA